MGGGRSEAEQFGPAVMAARVHQLLALIDQREVQLGDGDAFARAGDSPAIPSGCDDCGEEPPEVGPTLGPVSLIICLC